jgi:hypothetical protein
VLQPLLGAGRVRLRARGGQHRRVRRRNAALADAAVVTLECASTNSSKEGSAAEATAATAASTASIAR